MYHVKAFNYLAKHRVLTVQERHCSEADVELTEEGKKNYKLFNLKNQVKDDMAELGARVYALTLEKPDFTTDVFVNTNVEKIKKLEKEITELENTK